MTANTIDREAVNQILSTFEKRIERLQRELIENDDTGGGWVFCWDKYALGSKIVDGKPRVVAIEDAMTVKKTDKRFFSNGGNEYAVLMTRKQALRAALKSVGDSYDFLRAEIQRQEASQ